MLNGVQAQFLHESVNQVRQTLATDYNAASIYLANAVFTATAKDGSQRSKPQRNISGIYTGKYSVEEWAALSGSEKQEVQRLHREKKNGRDDKGNQGRGNPNANHNHTGRGRGGQGRGHLVNGEKGRAGGRGNIRQVQQVQLAPYDEEVEPTDDDWVYDVDEASEKKHWKPKKETQSPGKYRRIATMLTRYIGTVTSDEPGRCELDSHADNTMLGKDAIVLEMYEGQRNMFTATKRMCPWRDFYARHA